MKGAKLDAVMADAVLAGNDPEAVRAAAEAAAVKVPAEKRSLFARLRRARDAPEDGGEAAVAVGEAEAEAEAEAEDEEKKLPPVPFLQLFRFSSTWDRFCMLLACICAALHGAIMPLFVVLFGSVVDEFGDTSTAAGIDDLDQVAAITDEVGSVAKWFLILGVPAFITAFVQVRFQLVASQSTCSRIRRRYFESIMRQDNTWFDEADGGELTARVAGDVNLIQTGIGDKLTSCVQFLAMFVVGFIVAFIAGWQLTLLILASSPVLMAAGAFLAKLAAETTGEGLGAYGAAGGVASEALGLIRIVTAYNGQEEEARRYEGELDKAYKAEVRKAAISGTGLGLTMMMIMFLYAIAYSFGAFLVRKGKMDPGDVIVAFISVLTSTFAIGQAAPSVSAIAAARGAAPYVYAVIDRESEIDPLDEVQGIGLDKLVGTIEFENVSFNYKTRVVEDTEEAEGDGATRMVLDRMNLIVDAGSSHALVGPSGCGKSTIARLVERFYDVLEGRVLLDGCDVRDLNVRWLRSQIGYVGQMPLLFKMSIRENIALGAALDAVVDEVTGHTVMRRREITDDEVVAAAEMANAHQFITKLPNGYDTMLGERGAMLSGGQKQRICIARALVRNPKILVLDESTAALDAQSERIVQDALERASAGRTSIIIAHRLSTVKNADVISVISNGSIAESGQHDELLARDNGAYRRLVELQNVQHAETPSAPDASDGDSVVVSKVDGSAEQYSKDSKSHSVQVSKTVSGIGAVEGREAEKEDGELDIDKGVVRRAFQLNAGEWLFILGGVFGSAIAGVIMPVMALVFSEIINVLIRENDPDDVRFWSLMFVAIGVAALCGHFMQVFLLGISGERLTRKMRGLAFRALLRQDMGFFDRKENALGALTTKLATEASEVRGITGTTLGSIAVVVASIVGAMIIAFASCWRVALIVLSVLPAMAAAAAFQMKLVTGFDAGAVKKFAKAGAVAAEGIDNIETVSAIGVQDLFIRLYGKELDGPLVEGRKVALVAGIAFGCSEFLTQVLFGLAFWVGSIFIRNGQCDFVGLFKSVNSLFFAAMGLGQVSTYMSDVGKAKVSATNIFRLVDRTSDIDPTAALGTVLERSAVEGAVAAKDVKFEYPSRPSVPVLRGLSVDIAPGRTLALVGASGTGKSTIVALLERFYDVSEGSVSLDGQNIKDLNVSSLRSQIGFVSQEPDLFNRTVRDNIAYGLSQEDGTPVTENMIQEAAVAANAHEFILNLPQGYDTFVGTRGSHLSGGQRQRVAIARSLARKPRILLLDEATRYHETTLCSHFPSSDCGTVGCERCTGTNFFRLFHFLNSALDAVSERVVQDALDKVSADRTTIAIAHRLSTIKNADVIAVVSRGRIVERGSHEELLRIPNGQYENLVRNQMSNETPTLD